MGVDLTPDGKLLLSGRRGPNDYALARLHPDGTPDQSFGDAGVVLGQFKAGLSSAISAAFVTSDEKLVLVGKVYIDDRTDYRAVTRLNRDGTVDSTFGDQGSVILDLQLEKTETEPALPANRTLQASSSAANALLQADGKIVVLDTFGRTAVTFRLNPDGSPDTSFNGTGYVILGFTDVQILAGSLYVHEGRITIAGSYRDVAASQTHALVVRYNADGSLDNGFGENGLVIVPLDVIDGYQCELHDAIKEANGNILAIGSTNVAPLKAVMLGLNGDGSVDSAFNGGKALLTEIGTSGCQWNNAALDIGSGLNVVCGSILGIDSAVTVGRIDNEGTWDAGFGAGQGWVKIAVVEGHTVNWNVAVQSDGNILVCGFVIESTGLPKGFVARVLG
ncbi:MAG: hypothetical protein K0R45_1980 [Pseudomonas sp.]|nr:hypothetical protein [Pseudomonas sp.]